MSTKRRVFSYNEIMMAIGSANKPQEIAGILILAFDGWRQKKISNYSMSAILQSASVAVKSFGD